MSITSNQNGKRGWPELDKRGIESGLFGQDEKSDKRQLARRNCPRMFQHFTLVPPLQEFVCMSRPCSLELTTLETRRELAVFAHGLRKLDFSFAEHEEILESVARFVLATLGSSDVPGRSQKLGDNADISRFWIIHGRYVGDTRERI